jgi:hypothetical protein
MQNLIRETGLINEKLCVAMMTRSFRYGDGCGAKPEECFSRGTDQLCVGVHRSSGNVFDDIGLEENRFPSDVQVEEGKSLVNECVESV